MTRPGRLWRRDFQNPSIAISQFVCLAALAFHGTVALLLLLIAAILGLPLLARSIKLQWALVLTAFVVALHHTWVPFLIDDTAQRWQSTLFAVTVSPLLLFAPATLLHIHGLRTDRISRYVVLVCAGLSLVAFLILQWLSTQQASLTIIGIIVVTVGVLQLFLSLTSWLFVSDHSREPRIAYLLILIASLVAIGMSDIRLGGQTDHRIAILWPDQNSAPNVLEEYGTTANRYGWSKIGLHGELPTMLAHSGFSVTKVYKIENIGTPALLVASLFRPFSSNETTALLDYMRSGGTAILVPSTESTR